ncbi:GNAT family N-acetyltransferase [Streptomyces sp. NPDC051684]|uniref:GNAT family N-acetyltransferase n=1 Tax=Streptomyces sp. NPDC051684 TaxID=3365670 RepID=UPI0037A36C66
MIEVRAMALEDVTAVAALRVSGWRAAYAGIVPPGYLDAMSAEEDAARRRRRFRSPANRTANLVATDTGTVIGWAAVGPLPDPAAGELLALYVLPERTGSGVGRLLLNAVRSHAADLGFHRLDLWVLAANTEPNTSTPRPASPPTARNASRRTPTSRSVTCGTRALSRRPEHACPPRAPSNGTVAQRREVAVA